jgi:hypothetical protein
MQEKVEQRLNETADIARPQLAALCAAVNIGMGYDAPILSPEHFAWCCAEAERRHDGKVIRDDESGMLLCEDDRGVCHTDAVLCARSRPTNRPTQRRNDARACNQGKKDR